MMISAAPMLLRDPEVLAYRSTRPIGGALAESMSAAILKLRGRRPRPATLARAG